MPVDYSKWDALELSDDSDIEVHPNVDKRSFINAKQNQIHAERAQRKHQIETLKYERQINDGLIKRISALLASFKARAEDAQSRNPAEVAFQAVMESAGNPQDDKPPERPAGVHAESEQPPSYTKMMAALLDQVNKALDEKKPEDRYAAMVEEIDDHLGKVTELQGQLLEKLAELEQLDKGKITSDGIRDGFNTSHVAKAGPSAPGASAAQDTQVELLNPGSGAAKPGAAAAGAGGDNEDDEIEASPEARQFANIKSTDYQSSHNYIMSHPSILSEKETDGILVLAFDAELQGKDVFAQQCVHQALLLQYSRALGKNGASLFMKRITTKGHQAQEVFYKDVRETYQRIKTRAKEINANRAAEAGSSEGVEQIQLHAVEPGTEIKINVPPANSEDEGERQAREIFEGFSEDMRKALETGSLDKVNDALGKMKVDEAETLVGLFGDAGILSIEENVIDTTTEEGRKHLEEMKEQAALEEGYAAEPE